MSRRANNCGRPGYRDTRRATEPECPALRAMAGWTGIHHPGEGRMSRYPESGVRPSLPRRGCAEAMTRVASNPNLLT